MSGTGARWVLAFDASCATCRTASQAIGQACQGRVEVLPLLDPEVRRLRHRALGPAAPWAPTLVRIQGPDAQAWTGTAMAIRLARALGPRATLRVLRSLGRVRRQRIAPAPGQAAAGPVIGRGRFLQLGAGLAVAAGMLVTGRVPALAGDACAAARSWVAANRDRLPESYDEIAARPVAYRRAILEALPPSAQSRLWAEHVRRHRAAHPELTAEQAAVVDRAAGMAGIESTFEPAATPDLGARLKRLEDEAVQALGRDRARALLATFGPPETASPATRLLPGITGCTCSVDSDYCANGTVCEEYTGDCRSSDTGCGTFYRYPCDGRCFNR